MIISLTPPQIPQNSDKNLRIVYGYLYGMVQQLNTALNSLSADNFEPEAQLAIKNAAAGINAAGNSTNSAFTSLKSMIIKNAEIVKAEMDIISQRLSSDYVAQSEFGEYKKQVTNDITVSANGVIQQFKSSDQVLLDALNSYKSELSGYIKTGILDDGVIGVEITQGDNYRTRFTSSKMAFYQGNDEIAYMSNNRLYINSAVIKTELIHNDLFKVIANETEGYTIKYIGG